MSGTQHLSRMAPLLSLLALACGPREPNSPAHAVSNASAAASAQSTAKASLVRIPPPVREDEIWGQSADAREAADIKTLCRVWARDVMAFQFAHPAQPDDEQNKGPSCAAARIGLPVTGTLPAGHTVAGSVALHYFVGALGATDYAIIFRKPDGTLLGGPIFREDSDDGDGGETLAVGAWVESTPHAPALVVAYVSDFPFVDGQVPTPDGPHQFHHHGRSCLWTGIRYACEPFTVFERQRMEPAAARAFLAAPVAARPQLDPSGRVRAKLQ
jgi:hypothetical protein